MEPDEIERQLAQMKGEKEKTEAGAIMPTLGVRTSDLDHNQIKIDLSNSKMIEIDENDLPLSMKTAKVKTKRLEN